ncbi:glycosyltransferase [Paenibacillus massiliensis]|uniref:glycosyltransferase n=1 Tax=Paenibacillus massiliensis TaxID=225917 RepID=UPI00037523B4|nr:glycosyltransferase [Paenibacillus massiliensis]
MIRGNKIKALFVNGLPIDMGGIEKSTMEILREINHEKLQLDFAVRKPDKGCFHDEIENYGGEIYNVFEKTKHKGKKKWNLIMDIYSLFGFYRILKQKGPYNAIHIVHPFLDGFLIIAAILAKVPVRIVHSRYTGIDDKIKPGILLKLTRKFRASLCKKYATHIWGCSIAAAQHHFGKTITDDKRLEIPENPIKVVDYLTKKCTKDEACSILNISYDNINFLHVGRFTDSKNQLFLLSLFSQLLTSEGNIHLVIVGGGALEDQLKDRIQTLGIERNVTMLPSDTNIQIALAASDYFLFPSLYEGFGNVLIEAQAAGVPCIASDRCPTETNMGLIDYLPLEQGTELWEKFILNILKNPNNRELMVEKILNHDVTVVAPRMEGVYIKGQKYYENYN